MYKYNVLIKCINKRCLTPIPRRIVCERSDVKHVTNGILPGLSRPSWPY